MILIKINTHITTCSSFNNLKWIFAWDLCSATIVRGGGGVNYSWGQGKKGNPTMTREENGELQVS